MENSNDSPKYEVHFHGKAVGVAIGDNARVVWSQTTGHHLVPPMPPSSWVDREQEIGLLKDALTKGHPVAIWGPGGIGKTALAAKIASECKDIVGGIQNVAWFEIREDQGLDDLQNNLIIHFGEELNELEQSTRFDRVRALLSAQSRLLVFDQCENLQQQEEYFIKWLESLPIGTRILLAGRHQPLFGNALQPLNSLAIEESIKLFQSVALEAGLREAPAAELVRPICETLAGYPLAIRLAAPISKLGNISALRTQIETTGLSGVDAALTISYDTLNDNQKKHFRSLGLVTLPFDLGAVEIICELTTSDAAIYCAELTRRALLSFDETLNLYDMHPLIRRYAQSKVGIEETPETKNIHNRIANYYLSKQSKGLTPEQIFAYCDHLDKSERYDEIVDVLGQIDDTLAKHGYWNELTNLWERVVVHIDSFSTPEQKINAWNGLAIMYHLQSRWEKSLKAFNQILELDSDLKWHEIYVQSLLNMGTAYTNIGSLDKAYEVLTKAKDLSREWELRSFEPDALLDIGKIHEWRRADEQALEVYQDALTVSRELKQRSTEARALNVLGSYYSNRDEEVKALKYYQDSLEIQRELDNDKGIASCWNNLGGLYARQGRWERALTAFSYDREIHVKMGDKAGEANALANMGALFAQQGHFNKSIEALLQSIMISREINNSRILRNALTNLGVNRVLAGNLHEALGVWSEAITIERQLDHPDLAKSTSYIEELKAIKDTTSEDPKQQSFIERIRKANVESEKGGIARKTIMRLISKAADNQDHDEGTEILAEVVGIAEEISDPKIDDYRELLRDIRSIVREERERKAIADMAQHLWEEGEKLLFSGKSFTAGLKAWEEAVVLAERIKAPDLEKMKEMLAGVRETITSAPQMEEFADIWNRGARYIQVHEDEKALPYLEQAMEYLEKNLALRLKFSKTADESEKNLRSLRERIARKKEEDHPDVVTDIGRLNEETMALVRSGNLEQALATCEKMLALETSITFPYLRTHQKLNERIRFGLEKQREGHPVQFIEEEDEARNEFDKLWTQGQELSQTGNMTKALGIFGQAIQIGEQLNIPDWEKYLREYVKIGHDVILAEARELWQKGSEMVASGELTEALPLWEKAVELTRPLKYSGQSKVENMLNKLHQAIEYERAGQPVLFLPDKKSADAVIEKLWREGEALIESGRLLDAYSKWEDATTIALQFKHQNLDTYRIALLKLKQEIIQMQNEKKGLKGLLERLGKQK